MKKKMTLPLLALCIANSTVLACINNRSVICHASTPPTHYINCGGAREPQGATSTGTIYMAYGGAATGLDAVGYFNTTCDYTIDSTDCTGFTTHTPQSDPYFRSYADGNPCPGG